MMKIVIKYCQFVNIAMVIFDYFLSKNVIELSNLFIFLDNVKKFSSFNVSWRTFSVNKPVSGAICFITFKFWFRMQIPLNLQEHFSSLILITSIYFCVFKDEFFRLFF